VAERCGILPVTCGPRRCCKAHIHPTKAKHDSDHYAAVTRLQQLQEDVKKFIQGYLPDFDIDREYPGLPCEATSMTLPALKRVSDLIDSQLGTVHQLQNDAELCTGAAASERARQLLEETHGEYAQALRAALTPATRTVTVFEVYTRAINLAGIFFWTAYGMHPRHDTITAEKVVDDAFSDASVDVLDYGVNVSLLLRSMRDAERDLARHSLGDNRPMILEHVVRTFDENVPTVCPGHFKAVGSNHLRTESVILKLLHATRDEYVMPCTMRS
jgi:hypothetical protein